MGKTNENRDKMMQGPTLDSVTQENNMGVIIDTEGKQMGQCSSR